MAVEEEVKGEPHHFDHKKRKCLLITKTSLLALNHKHDRSVNDKYEHVKKLSRKCKSELESSSSE